LDRGINPPIRPCKLAKAAPVAKGRAAGVRNSSDTFSLDFSEQTQKDIVKEQKRAAAKAKAQAQKQYGTQNFEKSQRNLAIKAVAFPDPSDEGSVGYDFEGFVVSDGGPTIKPKDMAMVKALMNKRR